MEKSMVVSSNKTAPPSIRDLKQQIAERRIRFSSLLEQAMRLLLSRPEIAAFGTLQSVSRTCSVSGTTIARLASHLGYSSFREMKTAFQQYLISCAQPANGDHHR